jgi:TonB family protein
MSKPGIRLTALFASLIFSALTAFGQTCNLNIGVYKFAAAPTEELIENVAIELRNGKTRKTVRPVSKQRNGYFENLAMGQYKLTLKKEGFKRTLGDIYLTCEYAWLGTVEEVRFLWEGDPKQTVDMTTLASKYPGGTMYRLKDGSDAATKATYLPKPAYPPAARAIRATGRIEVQVLINEVGRVIWAKAVSGNPLLLQSAENAARGAKFRPFTLEGILPVKVSGVIVYNFVP